MERIVEPTELQLEFSKKVPSLVLASSSPNRKALLESGGSKVIVFSPNTEEKRNDSAPISTMLEIVRAKFQAYTSSSAYIDDMIAISADTLVLKDNKLLGKPKDREDASYMLHMLSGSRQTVLTAVGLHIPQKEDTFFIDSADVLFKPLSDSDIDSYISTYEWQGAAGGYRLQRTGYRLVDKIIGDWTTVVGLPLRAILDRLIQ